MRVNRNGDGVEFWLYFDAYRKNGVIFAVFANAITLYTLKDGVVTMSKHFA